MAKKQGIQEFLKGTGERITVGQYEIRKLDDGSYWLEHCEGEGTQCAAKKFEELISEFFWEIF